MPKKLISIIMLNILIITVFIPFSTSSLEINSNLKDKSNSNNYPTLFYEKWHEGLTEKVNEDEKGQTNLEGFDLKITGVDAWFSPHPDYINNQYGFISFIIMIKNIGDDFSSSDKNIMTLKLYTDNELFYIGELQYNNWEHNLWRSNSAYWFPVLRPGTIKVELTTTAEESDTSNNLVYSSIKDGITIECNTYNENNGEKNPLKYVIVSSLSEIMYFSDFYSLTYTDSNGYCIITAPYKENSGSASTYIIKAEYEGKIMRKTTPQAENGITSVEFTFGEKSKSIINKFKILDLFSKFFEQNPFLKQILKL